MKKLLITTITLAAIGVTVRAIKNKKWLDHDIKKLIIETDNEHPKLIGTISETLNPEKGYRIRAVFKD